MFALPCFFNNLSMRVSSWSPRSRVVVAAMALTGAKSCEKGCFWMSDMLDSELPNRRALVRYFTIDWKRNGRQ